MKGDQTWTEEQLATIFEKYPTLGPKGLAPILGMKWKRIYDKARKLGVKVKPEFIHRLSLKTSDVSKLTSLTDPRGLYILGLVWADGNITNRAKRKGYSVTFTLVETDFVNIEKTMLKTGEWRVFKRHEKSLTRNNKPVRTGSLASKELHEFLTNYDYLIKSHTSPTKILKDIPEELRHYWWRGYFDGDGSVSSWRDYHFCFCGPYDQDWGFAEDLLTKLEIDFSLQRQTTDTGRRSAIRGKREEGCVKFFDYIYKGIKFGLKRKYIAFDEIKKNKQRKNR